MLYIYYDSYGASVKKLFGYSASWRGSAYWKTLQCIAARDSSQERRHYGSFNGRRTRWDSLLYEVYAEAWFAKASTPDWNAGMESFIQQALQICGMGSPCLSRRNRKAAVEYKRSMARPPRTLDYDATVVPWIRNDGPSVKHATLFEVLSDSELVVSWILGRAKVTGQYGQRVALIQNLTQ
jgi:hypothetical protein